MEVSTQTTPLNQSGISVIGDIYARDGTKSGLSTNEVNFREVI